MKVLVGPNNMGLEKVLDDLRAQYPQVEFAHCASREALPEALADADVFMGWVSGDDLRAAKRLR
ncbi:MAG: hypothetical protein GX649_07055, partial [Chloroflexi bacterium]|nr:hypothetical protein [Chloroflexota bacterium]